ncbi:MAG: thiamine-phosphate kinase [Caldithrix sp.]|nr:thiamine-phosphate kinase [Caldithrix sp.]
MKLSDIGEFGLIEKFIEPPFVHLQQKGQTGIGDDCAILPYDRKHVQLLTTDLLIGGSHFLRHKISPADLGFKSLAVNLSDIAAMGGTPIGSILSIALPGELDVQWIEHFMQGYHQLSDKEGTPLLGGDTTKSENNIVINVAVLGRMDAARVKLRSGAQTGDIICVPDVLGDSAGGLQCLLNDVPRDASTEPLYHQHFRPYPKMAEGQWFAAQRGVHAMLDISDGVSSDLMHILNRSSAAAEVNVDAIPLSEALQENGRRLNWNIMELALAGGEDYSLLITVDGPSYSGIAKQFEQTFKRPLHAIGKIIKGDPQITYLSNGKIVSPFKQGYTHF